MLAQLDPLVDQRDGEATRAPATAARATAGPPWPYPWALTTAHSSAGAARWASTAALCATAARSISAQAGRERPCAMVTSASSSAGTGTTSRIGAPSATAAPRLQVRLLRRRARPQGREQLGHQGRQVTRDQALG